MKNTGIESLYHLFCKYVEIHPLEWEKCKGSFGSAYFPKKSILLNQDEMGDKIFFVATGLLRIYFNNEKGEEKTFHFCMQNTFAADCESAFKNKPSNFSIEALEDSLVIVMTTEMVNNLYNTLRYGEKLNRLITEDHFYIINEKIRSLYMSSPLERYEAFSILFPGVIQRVTQYHIASYLNISPVHLSRIKYQLQKKHSND